jgi:hypothetical protein
MIQKSSENSLQEFMVNKLLWSRNCGKYSQKTLQPSL